GPSFTISVTVTNAGGCAIGNKKVTASPDATITVNPNQKTTVCTGSSNAASVPDAGANANYFWSISNGTITQGLFTPEIIFTAPASGASFTISVTVTTPSCNNPGATGNKTIPLVAPPDATI